MRSLACSVLLLASMLGPAMLSARTTGGDTADQKLARRLAGLKPGATTECIDQYATHRTEAIGPTILYSSSRSVVYRNDTAGGCERIARGDILVTVSPSGRLCRGDLAHTIDPISHMFTGSCALGAFTRYAK